jgi:ADP-heptose:LPS heptosyltransferase
MTTNLKDKIYKVAHRKVILRNFQAPGDIVVLTAAIRDLKLSYPNFLIDVRTTAMEIWENNPYLTPLNENDKNVEIYDVGYPLIHNSNEGSYHFIHGFRKDIEDKLKIKIKPEFLRGDIHISDAERGWYSAVYEELGKDVQYWIINAGYKNDYTCKQWDFQRYQKIIDELPEITFVQIGVKDASHIHPKLTGKNLINLVGETSNRQLIRLIYNSFGVITPCLILSLLILALKDKVERALSSLEAESLITGSKLLINSFYILVGC